MIGLVAGVALYTIAGFLIAPRAIKLWIESPNVSGPTCRLRVQSVRVNPFTMFLSFKNVTLFGEENKVLISATRAETKIWTVGMFRTEKPGRDVAIRSLIVKSADSGGTMLAVPGAFARSVTVGADGAFIDATFARLERAEATVARDDAASLRRHAWLSVPGDKRTAACISLDGFEVLGGRLRMKDDAVTPSVQLELHDVTAAARRKPGRGAAPIEIDVEGRVDAAGTISIKARLSDPIGRHPDLFSMTARNVNLQPLSPYFRRIFGRDIVAGFGTAILQQERNDATVRFDNHLSVDRLTLGDAPADTAYRKSPLELALALTTDTASRGEFFIQGSLTDAQKQTVVGVFADSLAAELDNLAARPFEVLAEVAEEPDAVLDKIAFLPGSTEMAPAAMDTLALLANALGQRPQLGLRVRPAYDLKADRDAIAAQQLKLHIALATSKSAREGDETTDPDFDDPGVRGILDEFAGARLTEAQRHAVTRNVSHQTAMYRAIYLALVANERVSETVLRRLARFRARSAVDALEREGVDRSRILIIDALDTAATDAGTVSLKVEVEARLAAHDPDASDGERDSDGN